MSQNFDIVPWWLSHAHQNACTIKYEHLRQVIGGHFRGAAKSFLVVLALNYANCLLLAPSLTQGSSYKYYPLRSDGAHIPQDVCGLRKETKILDRAPVRRDQEGIEDGGGGATQVPDHPGGYTHYDV